MFLGGRAAHLVLLNDSVHHAVEMVLQGRWPGSGRYDGMLSTGQEAATSKAA